MSQDEFYDSLSEGKLCANCRYFRSENGYDYTTLYGDDYVLYCGFLGYNLKLDDGLRVCPNWERGNGYAFNVSVEWM